VAALAQWLHQTYGRVDILVNNAGISRGETDADVFDTNYYGVNRVVLSDVLGGKDVVEGRDGWTDSRFCLLGIGRNGQILQIFSRICSNMLEYLLIGRT
jgi:NAD(P)-dependent dehydrogenase (short-subunit alcohol dehydrogenase family)